MLSEDKNALHFAIAFATVLLLVPWAAGAVVCPGAAAGHVQPVAVAESVADDDAAEAAQGDAEGATVPEVTDGAAEAGAEAAEVSDEKIRPTALQDDGLAIEKQMRYLKVLWLLFNLTLVLFLLFIFFLIFTIRIRYQTQLKRHKTTLEDLWWSPRWGADIRDEDRDEDME